MMGARSVSIAVAGSGGAGVITTGAMLLEAAGHCGWYAYMARSVGAQIRGGETVALMRLGLEPVDNLDDHFDLLVGVDWQNLGKYAAEMALSSSSLIIGDPDQGEVPSEIRAAGAREAVLPMKKLARTVQGGRPNMIALGAIACLLRIPLQVFEPILEAALGQRGEKILRASRDAFAVGADAAARLPEVPHLTARPANGVQRWDISGNEATGLGALKGGIRFVAGYPITPATEVLEWMARPLSKVGGTLIQAEDELSSINQIIGASFGGVPSLTATAGPGLSLMMESIGLAVASETPIVVVDVMRVGPSTGIAAKSEQSDLNIAFYGLHGDAPHLVVAPNTIADCQFTTQWAVQLAESLQTVAIVLSDQSLGQARAIIDHPADASCVASRETVSGPPEDGPYLRYALTPSGVSPMALPGTPGCQYTAEGLEHTQAGTPSSQVIDHVSQLDKRLRKLTGYDFGEAWADIEGDGDTAILTWGSCTGAAREAQRRLADEHGSVRLISIRLLSPVQPQRFAEALKGVKRLLVVEQSHSGQFWHYLRAHYDLPADIRLLNRPGPLPIRPHEISQQVLLWT